MSWCCVLTIRICPYLKASETQ
ncbi:hypothetical protein V12B01_13625 [Vibrio splendidus 12B01]|nr:hypothetical protein V12B01_13625 [Vibrio splendidus 12B01]